MQETKNSLKTSTQALADDGSPSLSQQPPSTSVQVSTLGLSIAAEVAPENTVNTRPKLTRIAIVFPIATSRQPMVAERVKFFERS